MRRSVVRFVRRSDVVTLASALLLSLPASLAFAQRVVQNRDYDCKVIARSNEFPLAFGIPPFENAYGDVAFVVPVDVAGYQQTQIRLGRGDTRPNGVPITQVILRAGGDPSDPTILFDSLLSAAILDDLGRAVVTATMPPSATRSGIYSANRTSQPHLLYGDDDTDPSSMFTGFGISDPIPSPLGVLFGAADSVDTGLFLNGSFVAPIIDNSPGGFSIFPQALMASHSLDIAWIGQEFNSLRMAVFLNQVAVDESVDVMGDFMGAFSGLSVSANALPFVAYSRDGFPPDTEWKLVVTSSIGSQTLVDASVDPFSPFEPPIQTSVNAWAEVAFTARPDLLGRSVLLADGGPVVHRVRCPAYDQFLDNYQITPRALNSDGQIAFMARYFDTTTSEFNTYLMRADPLPGQGARPTSCLGLADGTACDDGEPETISSCSAFVCLGDPLGRPTSCVGLPDNDACDDQDPGTYSFCQAQTCVGVPVPEPEATWLACAAIAVLVGLGRPTTRPGDPRPSDRRAAETNGVRS